MSVGDAIVSTVKEIVQTALISLAIFFFVYIFLVQPHRVKGDSMLPNFKDGELLLTEKVTYRIYKPQRGDVIVFRAPSANVDYIKRIIGLPGETLRVEDGTVIVNDQKLVEPYETQKTQGNETVTLGKDQYFVLGDNRNASSDSRTFGPIAGNSIKGKVWLVYWPIVVSAKSNGFRMISTVHYTVADTLHNL